MKIPVIAVATNEAQELRQWLDTLRMMPGDQATPVPCVVDNGSSDNTSGVIWHAVKEGILSKENVFWMPSNRGFALAQNHAFRQLGTRNEYRCVATLNIDAQAESNWLAKLVEEANKSPSDVGMWGCRVLQPKPDHDRISSDGHALRANDGAFLDVDWNRPVGGDLFSNKPSFEPFSPCFAAALWSFGMLSSVGLPDNDQFLYYDDVDLAFKARILGWSARHVSEAIAYHPLPNSKRTHPQQGRFQTQGRLLMVSRYFPEPERTRVLSSLTLEERHIFDSIDARRKRQFGSEEGRRKVFDVWANRWLPLEKNALDTDD